MTPENRLPRPRRVAPAVLLPVLLSVSGCSGIRLEPFKFLTDTSLSKAEKYLDKVGTSQPADAPERVRGPLLPLGASWGQRLRVVSRVRTFDVELSGVSPLACRLVLQSLDAGWRNVQVNGQGADAGQPQVFVLRSPCGWFGGNTIALTSAG